jgi:hypothetical protein
MQERRQHAWKSTQARKAAVEIVLICIIEALLIHQSKTDQTMRSRTWPAAGVVEVSFGRRTSCTEKGLSRSTAQVPLRLEIARPSFLKQGPLSHDLDEPMRISRILQNNS